jgi:hypothetical protein
MAAASRRSALRPLLRLYPRRWRARYGAEFGEVLDAEPMTVALVVDVLFGAVDARVRPQAIAEMAAPPSAPREPRGGTMIEDVMKLRCAGYGPNVTRRDQWAAVAVMLGGTVVLTLIWMLVHVRFGDNPYVDSFSLTPFLTAMFLSMPLTYLKGRPAISQAAFISCGIAVLAAFSLLLGFITARI